MDVNEKRIAKIPGADTGITVKTGICGLCGDCCLIDAYMKDGKVIKVEGNDSLPGQNGQLCVKGSALRQNLYHPDRILHPMRRVGKRGRGQFEPITWEEALDEIADRMQKTKETASPDQTMIYVGHPKWFRTPLEEFAKKYGTSNYGTESSTCAYSLLMAFNTVYGIPAFPMPDVKNTKTLVIWGNNDFYSHTPGSGKLKQLKKAGKKLIVVDPRKTPVTELADLHLQAYPGTDGALALGIAHVLIRDHLYDAAFVEENTIGFEEYSEYVQEFTPEKVERITTVPAVMIEEAAHLMVENGPCSLMMSAAPVVHNVNGFQNARAVVMLMALTGNYQKQGGIMAPGPRPLRLEYGFTPGRSDLDRAEFCLSAEKYPLWTKLVKEVQTCDISRYLMGEGKYPIRNLISFGMNHHMWPRPDLVEQAFTESKDLELFVVADSFCSDSAKYADILLPTALYAERDQVTVIGQDHVFYQEKVIEQPDVKKDVEILIELGKRLGFTLGEPAMQNNEDYLNLQLSCTGITLDDLKHAPDHVLKAAPVGGPAVSPRTVEASAKKYPTPSGKIEFRSSLIAGEDALPKYRDFREKLPMDQYPFILGTGNRKAQLFHSRTYRLPWLANLEPYPLIDMNPEDAESLNLEEGEMACLSTPIGSINLQVHPDASIPKGMVNVYHGAGSKDINYLLDIDYVDPFSGFPGFKSYCCNISKLEKE